MLRQQGWEQHDFTDPNAFSALYSGDDGASKAKVFAILNARYHEQEAYIIAQAGVPGAITIATNMAGRGTDIQLGGNPDMRVKHELADVPEGPERERPHRRHQGAGGAAQGEGDPGRRHVRARHRAAREPAHRQPAARPLRPPGRPRPFQVLPVARRRPDAHLRLRQARHDAAAPRPQGERGDRPFLDQQGAGEGAAEGRGAQLRHPQEPAQVRQRDERPAQGHLRPARRVDEGRGRRRDRRRHAPFGGRGPGRQARAGKRLSGAVGHQGIEGGARARAQSRSAGRRMGEGRGHRRGGADHPRRAPGRRAHGRQGRPVGPRRHALCGEVDPAADARSSVARAPAHARAPAPGDRVARLRAARSAQRVQGRNRSICSRPWAPACARPSPRS